MKTVENQNLKNQHFEHKKTGAQHVHLASAQSENVFMVAFRTIPTDSTGVAHILEHTALCGSRKFPVRDPFFMMIRRSLNTFMNAFTSSDWTAYPFATQNRKDYFNLLSVYLDSAFFSRLDPLDFAQEGHRFEFADPTDSSSELLYKGVVFNEMKGAMGSMQARFWQHLFHKLYPDLTYRHNSGGDPREIPTLTHEELVEFHRYFYHPSNAVFYFYGNIDTKTHLDFIDQAILSTVDEKKIYPPMPRQKRFSSPIYATEFYPAKEGEEDVVGFAFLTAHAEDIAATFALSLLESILFDTDASPLKKSLLDAGIKSVEAYFETELSEAPFIILCKGVGEKTSEDIADLLFSSLKSLAKNRIDPKKIEEALHALEFSKKEIHTRSYPYGLHLFMRAILPKQHGVETNASLEIDQVFQELRNKTKNPEYLSLLIHTYFLDNPHYVALTVKPDTTLLEKEEEEEKNTLQSLQKKLKEEDKKTLISQAKKLKIHQEKMEHQSLDCLPKLSLKDVNPSVKTWPLEEKTVFFSPVFTNHIVYIDACISLPKISQKDLPYVSLFAGFLSEVGTKSRSYQENLSYMNAHLGGFEAYLSTNISVDDPENPSPLLIIRTKALRQKAEKMCSFLKEMLEDVDFSDTNRMKQLIEKEQVEIKSHITSQAMHYAKSLARSGLSKSSYLQDLWYGFRYRQTVLGIDLDGKSDFLPHLLETFSRYKSCFFSQPIDWVVTADPSDYESLEKADFYGLFDRTIDKKNQPFDPKDIPEKNQSSCAYIIPSPVAFTALSVPAATYKTAESPALFAAAELMQNTVLHKEIREQGGAYGSGAFFDPIRGDFTFRAYRDPHLFSSLASFEKSVEALKKQEFAKQDLEDAILSVIQGFDQPISPGSRGLTEYLRRKKGITLAMHQNMRDSVLALDKKTIARAVDTIAPLQQGITISFSNDAFFAKENASKKSPLPIQPV